MQDIQTLFDRRLLGLGLALALGFLVGLEREWAENKPVGLRSTALIGALGGLSVLLSPDHQWPVAAGLLALGLVLAAQVRSDGLQGLTTIIAALVVYLVGAAAVAGLWLHAIVMAGAVTLTLHWKAPLHGWIDRLGKREFDVIARFVLLAAVILPVMPDRTFGPYGVFNPFEAWTLVVLIVGINVAGYVAFRLVDTGAGAWLSGVFGGFVSSTATTISYANLSKRTKQLGAAAALIILVASAVVYVRVIVEIAVVAPALLPAITGPSVAFGLILLAAGIYLHLRVTRRIDVSEDLAGQRNPAQIKVALSFAALYVLVLFAVAAARDLIGDEAVYAVAFVSGLTDVDALTLTIGQSFSRGDIAASMAWRAIFLASLANLLFKVAAASVLGSSTLRRWIVLTGGSALAAGIAILLFWPTPAGMKIASP